MRRPAAFLNLIFSRRSIRRFRPGKIDAEVLKIILEAAQSAPYYYQAFCFILLEKPEIKREINESCGGDFIEKAGASIVVCLDLNRISGLLDRLGIVHVLKADTYPVESVLGVFESGLAVMNLIMAAEVMGYGTLILDCALYECERISEILKLPHGVIPLVIVCIGEKDENPPPRPRWPLESLFHVDGYRMLSDEESERFLENMDKAYSVEGYLKKYAGWAGSYREYLANRALLTREVRRAYESISAFLRRSGFRP
ncbi:NADPH-dependent oxidoreductase [archaeon HR01]|nr:NADPH-dependent oxidoreductase [archaeon HR01]